jgi:hypothetical protein
MIQRVCGHGKPVDGDAPRHAHSNGRARWQSIVRHWKKWRLEHRLDIGELTAERGCPYRHRAALPVQRREERQPLHVIPVIVRQHDRDIRDVVERGTDADDARTGIENESMTALLFDDLDAGRIAAMSNRAGSGPRH